MPLEAARANRTPIEWRAEDCRRPSVTGVRVLDDFPLATLREYIDWTPFFHTWELKGVYPRILEHEKYGEQARQIFAEGNALLDTIIAEEAAHGARRLRALPGQRGGRRRRALHRRRARSSRARALPLPAPADGRRTRASRRRSLADFIAPQETGLRDHLGGFAVTTGIGLKELCDAVPRASTTTTTRSWPRRSPTGWPRPSPSTCTSGCATSGATAATRISRTDELIHEKYRGIRPAAGYPACPDHTEKGTLWRLLDVETNTGMQLTESFAMWPGSSVSGLYFAHPESRYFTPRQDRSRSGGRLQRAQGDDDRRGRALARPEPQLRSRALSGALQSR